MMKLYSTFINKIIKKNKKLNKNNSKNRLHNKITSLKNTNRFYKLKYELKI